MRTMSTNPLSVAKQFLAMGEVPGARDNTLILAMLQQDNSWVEHDEVPWCSAFVNFVAWLLNLPRSKSLAARSWLIIGIPVDLAQAQPGFDIVVFRRGANPTQGHVAFFLDVVDDRVRVVGGNQGNKVSIASFPVEDVVGVRRLG